MGTIELNADLLEELTRRWTRARTTLHDIAGRLDSAQTRLAPSTGTRPPTPSPAGVADLVRGIHRAGGHADHLAVDAKKLAARTRKAAETDDTPSLLDMGVTLLRWDIAWTDAISPEPFMGLAIRTALDAIRTSDDAAHIDLDHTKTHPIDAVHGVDDLLRQIKQLDRTTPVRIIPQGDNHYIVLLRGLDTQSLDPNRPDTIGLDNVVQEELTRGGTYAAGVRDALRAVGAKPGATLILVGHSLGGITAANLAGDPNFTATYHVSDLVTAGSPVRDQFDRVAALSKTRWLAIEAKGDPVPWMTTHPASRPVGTQVLLREAPPATRSSAHDEATSYAPIAAAAAATGTSAAAVYLRDLNSRVQLPAGTVATDVAVREHAPPPPPATEPERKS